jgi:radical SAM superfamily enzyme YgiQ (UPF0313 family)
MMTLSAVLKEKGHEVFFRDAKLEKDLVASIAEVKPGMLAYSITTNNWQYYRDLNLKIRKTVNAVSVFGGPHCTFFPDFIQEEGVDVICRGEGEAALSDLAAALDEKRDITGIQNLWVKKDGAIIKNGLRELVSDLDTLPFPDRELIDRYRHYRRRSRIRTITSRGCPYQCTYCFNHAFRECYGQPKKYFRQRSPEHVIEELKALKQRYHPRNFEFHDDIFILDRAWTAHFTELYLAAQIGVPFEINVRAELVNEEMVVLLKKAGCYSVQFGVEAGNPQYRKEHLQRNLSDEEILNAALLLRKHGIKTNTFNLLCLPGETLAMAFETLRLNAACKVTYAMNSIYQPYPGTRLADRALAEGYYDGDIQGFGRNYLYGQSIMKGADIRKIERLHYLFAYGVKFPFLNPLIAFLIKLPFNKLYQMWYFLLRSYYVIFVFKRLSIKELFITETGNKTTC